MTFVCNTEDNMYYIPKKPLPKISPKKGTNKDGTLAQSKKMFPRSSPSDPRGLAGR